MASATFHWIWKMGSSENIWKWQLVEILLRIHVLWMTKNHRLEQWPTNTFYGSSRTRCDSQRVCGNRFAAKRRKQEGRPVSTPLGSASDAYILHWAICRHLFVSFVPHFPSFLRIPNSFADSNFGTPHTTTHYSELVKTALSSFYSFIINNELVDKVNVR